jgi:ElaB/YqjD/DUF883 family membrane-anchored ribosome-binding protein
MDEPFKSAVHGPSGQGTGTAARLREQVDAVADVGRKAVDRIDAQRDPVAATLDHTASALHQQADQVAGVAHATADHLHATAAYVRQHDMKAMAKDVGDLVRRYPGPALAAAAAVGFLIAHVVRPRD